MAKTENEIKQQDVEMENGTKGRKEYELTPQAKSKVFVVEALTQEFKKSTRTYLCINIDKYKKEVNLEPDEKGYVIFKGTFEKYQATFCDGVATDTGNPYLGIDIVFNKDYRKRVWFTRLEKSLLVEQGYLREVK